MTIEAFVIVGFIAGLIVGCVKPEFGCALLAVPVAMFAYIWWWQGQHPESLRSTSALDFVFGPLWTTIGAIGGYFVGLILFRFFRRG